MTDALPYCPLRRRTLGGLLLLGWLLNQALLQANPAPAAGNPVTQGSATVSGVGSSLVNINQTSANAFINWQSFNIDAGETVNFNQPSATSLTWNQINDANPSQILGTLNANGYVVLQNQNGFYVGGSAAINVHGLIMTTASTPNLYLSSGGAWDFNAPPPTAKIINYGQVNITGGGSAFLIASDIENLGTISAPNGKIGLYAGEHVLVSTSPDGRGLSAQVTLPAGSVDNKGNLIADAGSIAAQAQTVNQNGLVQANSVQDVNGTIELVASGNLTLGGHSAISATGDSTTTSPGGFVVLKPGMNAGDTIVNNAGSTLSVAGNAGGQNGIIEAFGQGVTASTLQSSIVGNYFAYLVNPYDMTLSYNGTDTSSSDPNFNVYDLAAYSQIDLQALDDIDFQTPPPDSSFFFSTFWQLPDSSAPNATLSLTAGNNINFPADNFGNNAGIQAGNNWSVNLTAGNGIYLWNNATIQAQNGDINLWAGNEVQLGWDGYEIPGEANAGSGSITTAAGGSINVTAVSGDINTGSSVSGFNWLASVPYYTPSSSLGGISTADGGDVTINAGQDVVSFPTTTPAAGDPESGAFGSAPGNVTINAGGSVYGNFVVVNGTGTINAGHNIGDPNQNVALSLVKGSWNLDAQNDINLQEVRNPNGVFNDTLTGTVISGYKPSAGNHLFDYDPQASVTLTAGNGVDITGQSLPRPDGVSGVVPMLLPPILTINAGQGGVHLQTPNFINASGQTFLPTGNQYENAITLFPSPYQELQITTTGGGNLTGGTGVVLLLSDSGVRQWYAVPDGYTGPALFGPSDHASVPVELGNENPVVLDISGSMNNLILQVSKLADITVDGDMNGCSFYGENLNANDATSITVGGQINYASSFTESLPLALAFPDILQLSQSLPAGETFLPPGTIDNWYAILQLAVVDPSIINSQTYNYSEDLTSLLNNSYRKFPGLSFNNLNYNPNTKTLTVEGPLSAAGDALPTPDSLYSILTSGTLYLPVYGLNGLPVLDPAGHFVIEPVTWLPPNTPSYTDPNLATLAQFQTDSQNAPPLGANGALIVGGTGDFDVTADSINLGNSDGILSVGNAGTPGSQFLGAVSYSYLTPYITSGANINVVADTLEMPSSTIAALGGGNVNVTCNGVISGSPVNGAGVGVSMDLGSPSLLPYEDAIMFNNGQLGLGVYATSGGNVTVTALGTINIDTSRIATFDGGDVDVTSLTGDVNAGSGGTIAIPINVFLPSVGLPTPYESVYVNGIGADTLALEPNGSLVPGAATAPGNITVNTPEGSIYASLGGILQESLNGSLSLGPTINLSAGTPAGGDWNSSAPPEYVGNIDLGQSGVIGGTVNVRATGKITGLLISEQNANVTGATLGNLTVLAAGTANVSGASGGAGITIIGGQGVNASGIGGGALLLGQNVSVNGGAAQNTLGSSANATASSQSAAQQSTQSAAQQVASNGSGENDEKKKKKNAEIRKVGRVTVILSAAVPPR